MKLELWSVYLIVGAAFLFAGLLTRCTAYKPEAVTLVRVDGGFMSCTTFIAVDGGAP